MKQKIFFSLFCAALVALMSLFPSTFALANKPDQWGYDFLIDNPNWAKCPDGAVIGEYTTFHSEVVGFWDSEGNWVRMSEHIRITDGGLYHEGTDSFLPWKVETDHIVSYGDPMTKWVAEWNSGLLTLPGYGRVTQLTGRWIGEWDPATEQWNITFQSGKYEINYDAICAYFGH